MGAAADGRDAPHIPRGLLHRDPLVADGVVTLYTHRRPDDAAVAALRAAGIAYAHRLQAWVSSGDVEAAVAAVRELCPWWAPQAQAPQAAPIARLDDYRPSPERTLAPEILAALDRLLERSIGRAWRGGEWRVSGGRALLRVPANDALGLARYAGELGCAVEAVTGEALHVVVQARGAA